MKIESSFPGGNIVVERAEGDDVYLHQDLRDTKTNWFYWCFQVGGAAGRTLRFHFTQSRAIGVRGPAISMDEGQTWAWLGSESVRDNSFSFTVPMDAAKVRMSFAMPYQESDWSRFIGSFADKKLFSRHSLCTTRKGRNVEYMLMGSEQPVHRIAVTCRHHCCEMMADYVLEGLIRWVLESSEAEALWMRDNVEFFIVPFVDKDGVEDGDQGKNRCPRDHGRDYEGESIYAPTRTIRRMIPKWGNQRLRVSLDIHCPHIVDSHIYLVGSPYDRIAAEQRRFSAILESVCKGPLPFHAGNYLPFGEDWNTAPNYKEGKTFSRWSAELPGIMLGTSIEIPYAKAGDSEVNQTSARLFGADIGRALTGYLQSG